jgi:hypothetical protein
MKSSKGTRKVLLAQVARVNPQDFQPKYSTRILDKQAKSLA